MTSQSTKRITAPVDGLNGLGVGGLQFVDSVAYTDNPSIIAYCESSGYTVEDSDNESGTAIRDAAIDPRPGDHHAPVHAGEADPHGPAVVSPEPDGHVPPHVEPVEVPEGDLDARVLWVSEAGDQDEARERANALYEHEKAAGDTDLEALSGRLTTAVYSRPVSGELVEDDGIAGTGPAVNAETGEVTQPGEALPPFEQGLDVNTVLPPAGNASREDWAAYALAVGATEADLADLGRDQIRDQFGNRAQG